MRLTMLLLYIMSALTISMISTEAAPLTNCTTNVSVLDLFEPFGIWHAIATASAEKHDGLNGITISMNGDTIYLYIDWDGICTKIEKIYSNSYKNALEEKWDYFAINGNEEYVILRHNNPGKCATETFLLFGKNPTVSAAIMEIFKMVVDCSDIPGLTIYTLPLENEGNCKISTPEK